MIIFLWERDFLLVVTGGKEERNAVDTRRKVSKGQGVKRVLLSSFCFLGAMRDNVCRVSEGRVGLGRAVPEKRLLTREIFELAGFLGPFGAGSHDWLWPWSPIALRAQTRRPEKVEVGSF